MKEISNEDLVVSDIPSSTADWETIQRFALTYNGYDECGSFDACADIANARNAKSLHELRASLFFEQRRWRHSGLDPDDESLNYIRSLIDQIRAQVSARS